MAQSETVVNPLEPLLRSFEQFSDIPALDAKIFDIYDYLDCDQSGCLSQKARAYAALDCCHNVLVELTSCSTF